MWKIVYTNPYEIGDEAEKINQLFEAGMDALHIRKPRYTKKQLREFIAQIDAQFYDRIILHSHYSLALEFGLKGIHLNRNTRLSWIFMNFMLKYYQSQNPDLVLTTTFTNLRDIKSCSWDFNYVLLGPLFNRNYKGNCLYRFHKPDLIKYLARTRKKVFALGGMNADRMDYVDELGFQGMALQSAIWKSARPVDVFLNMDRQDETLHEAV